MEKDTDDCKCVRCSLTKAFNEMALANGSTFNEGQLVEGLAFFLADTLTACIDPEKPDPESGIRAERTFRAMSDLASQAFSSRMARLFGDDGFEAICEVVDGQEAHRRLQAIASLKAAFGDISELRQPEPETEQAPPPASKRH